ncbi:class I SAM-dependent methyltransferase [Aetokthonos hydrillicola Thurmond2011]|jgi:trans-aconitate methyltransferase|uniref:Class I SAM-dependent methyltransferase n=1 Tax=Aetokthonos hydrillicola Thurmond2011 TaxID=2712845 RepID=A0AAP5M9R0_9CYAN|nr:class I SAM-dependent methyltransferase [Aetokthonos hydrillicola]MBO3461361.1 class I SAM-dependent methyltransferase [Aetokthonos hydrillicola CCALA 1050]MBW4589242.1 class I SAM-dependent methyltransferase [Aetokthonos hydrillicola CCALA 1050]MDR9900426.1 class I SAM-dependent methyltransferase [Aetokthonos hydrillicola Thurmond2011]
MPESENPVFKRDFCAYYDAVTGRPPRDTLLAALASVDSEPSTNEIRFAVDLGCGEGRDTVELLHRGWRVLAIDSNPEAIHRLLSRPDINLQLLDTQIIRFEEVILPESVNLINSSFALPFCPPEHFPSLWEKVVISLRVGGRFCGQLFGDRDSWAIQTSMNHHSRTQIEMLLQPFEIEMLNEEEHPGKTALGDEKYWHIFHIVARKKPYTLV